MSPDFVRYSLEIGTIDPNIEELTAQIVDFWEKTVRESPTIWKYDFETLRKDLSAHLVFGTATATAFSLLAYESANYNTRKESP